MPANGIIRMWRIGNSQLLVAVPGVRDPIERSNIKKEMNMTEEELKKRIDASKKAESDEIDIIRNRRKKERQDILKEWAIDNARFTFGDIIKSDETIIVVDKIFAQIGYSRPYIEYVGRALTKKLELRKDGWVTSIYDDSPDRNIKLLKKKQ